MARMWQIYFKTFLLLLASASVSASATIAHAAPSLLIESLRKPQAVVAATIAENFNDWQITCPNPALKTPSTDPCTMQPNGAVFSQSDKILRLYGRMITVQGKQVPVFIVQTSLDLLLSNGVSFKIDGRKPIKLAFRSCHADGCIIPFRMSGQIKSALQRGAKLSISVQTLDAKIEQVSLSLSGFTKALQKLAISR